MGRVSTAFLLGCAALAGVASAQTPEEIERYKKMTIFSLGGAVAVNAEPYEGVNDGEPNIFPVPFYVYNKNNLTLAGPNVSYRFAEPFGVTLSAEGQYRFQNYDDGDSPYLEGMDDRNGTFEMGFKAAERFGRLRLQAEALADVAGQHDGYEVTAQATFEVGNGRMISFRPIAGISYQSQNVINYYYGVRGEEAAVLAGLGPDGGNFLRNAYFPDAALLPYTGAQARIRLSRRVQLNGQVKAAFLPDEITDSPIVGKDTRTSAFVGISYMFSGPGVNGSGG